MALAESKNDDNLEILLAKATNPLHQEPDADIVTEFCSVIDKDHDGPQTALRLLAHKIQSPIEKESLMALSVLEETVRKCGSRYCAEIGKFRFLNEMIKVVSPKYLGNRASSKVKRKIVEMLYIWSLELKNESKISEAYQMLKRQGVVIEDPLYLLDTYKPQTLPPPPPRSSNSIFEDEEKAQQLQRLLSSKNAEDLQAANRLIKSMVKEADHRMEMMAKRSTELETVHNNASVLADMLDHYRPGETSEEEKDLMKELFESCERLRPKLFRLAGELDEKDEGLGDILKANDELTVVINNYKKIMGMSTENGKPSKKEASLLDLGSQSPLYESHPATSLLDDQLLALGLMENDSKEEISLPSNKIVFESSVAELDHIFSSGGDIRHPSSQPNTSLGSMMNSSNVFLNSNIPSLTPLTSNVQPTPAPPVEPLPPSKGLEELDEISQSLLKKSLPASAKFDFPSNTPQKVPLSQLMQQQKSQTKSDDSHSKSFLESGTLLPINKSSPACSPAHILSLKDVFVPLETVLPGSIPPLTLHEKNGLTVVLHFGKDSPRSDVTVMVVSTMSKNSSPVKSISFQAAVPKSMKIKLQPPSATDLPPYNPILPPATITQVMLLANPQKETVRLKYKVNYTVEDKDFTDLGEVENLFTSR